MSIVENGTRFFGIFSGNAGGIYNVDVKLFDPRFWHWLEDIVSQ